MPRPRRKTTAIPNRKFLRWVGWMNLADFTIAPCAIDASHGSDFESRLLRFERHSRCRRPLCGLVDTPALLAGYNAYVHAIFLTRRSQTRRAPCHHIRNSRRSGTKVTPTVVTYFRATAHDCAAAERQNQQYNRADIHDQQANSADIEESSLIVSSHFIHVGGELREG